MYCNCKDKEIRYDIDVTAAATPIVGSLVNLQTSNRIMEQFAVLAKGYGLYQINTAYRNGGMETAGAPLGSWTYATAGTTAITRTTVGGEFYAGSAGAKWVMDASHNVASLKQTVVTASRTYTVSLWAKGLAGGEKVDVLDNATVKATFTLTTTWTQYSVTYTSASTTVGVASTNDAANNSKTFYVDNVQVLDNTPFSIAPTTLTSALEASMDGLYWTSLQAVTQANDGTILYVSGKPCQMIRFNVTALTLAGDTATDYVRISVLAT